jgi:hypothetical protein
MGITMQNNVHEIRQANSRKILAIQCGGKVKQFAVKLGKKEQQCSNFLREKNPVNIGDSIARQIESTFGYPLNWLDYKVDGSEGITNSVHFEIMTLFADLNKSIDHIGTKAFKSISETATLITYSNVNTSIDKLRRISLSVKSEHELGALEYTSKVVSERLKKECVVDEGYQGFYCQNSFFILNNWSNVKQTKVTEMYIFREYPSVQNIYDYTPFVIDGRYRVFITKYWDAQESSIFNDDNFCDKPMTLAIKELKYTLGTVIQRRDVPPILIDCIDNNPDFK